jgi:hypothetical protein
VAIFNRAEDTTLELSQGLLYFFFFIVAFLLVVNSRSGNGLRRRCGNRPSGPKLRRRYIFIYVCAVALNYSYINIYISVERAVLLHLLPHLHPHFSRSPSAVGLRSRRPTWTPYFLLFFHRPRFFLTLGLLGIPPWNPSFFASTSEQQLPRHGRSYPSCLSGGVGLVGSGAAGRVSSTPNGNFCR